MKLLELLAKPEDKGGLRLDSWATPDITPRSMPYDIDRLGADITKYLEEDADGYGGETGGNLSGVTWENL